MAPADARPRRRFLGLVAAAAVLLPVAAAESAGQPVDSRWRAAAPGYAWEFPRDHWRHDGYSTEWWYFVGFAEGRDGRRFFWQFTVFRAGLAAAPPDAAPSPWGARYVGTGHAAVAEAGTGERLFVQVSHREAPALAEFGEPGAPEIASLPGPTGTGERWRLGFEEGVFRLRAGDDRRGLLLDLSLAPTRPPLFHGAGGYSEKSAGGAASHYYSQTRLRVSGRVGLGSAAPAAVTGSGWMDREFGSAWLTPEQVGWDWFGLTLRDGRDLMLYLLRREDGGLSYAAGTVRGADGAVRPVGEPSVEVLDFFAPPDLGAEGKPYPAGWRIRLPGESLDLTVRPLLADQENRRAPGQPGPDIPYWEGAVRLEDTAEGTPAGRGFVELTGYRRPFRAPGLAPGAR